MKKIAFTLCLLLLSYFSFAQTHKDLIPNEIIVKFKTDAKPDSKEVVRSQQFGHAVVDVLNRENNIQSMRLTGNKKQENTYLLKLNSNKQPDALINQYKQTGLFEYVEPNYRVKAHEIVETIPSDIYFSRQWSHSNDGFFDLADSTEDADMDTDLAWDITQGDPDLIIAILDTGARLDHPELESRIWRDGIDFGWDFINNDNYPADDRGHGTHVTGIALSSGNNDIGYAGVNWNSQIMICKVLGADGTGSNDAIAEGIYYAVDNGASVINMSLGGGGPSIVVEDAVNYAYDNNVVVIASTGNDNGPVSYPAKFENAIAVGSTDPEDKRSFPFPGNSESGSNFGDEIDVVAPGSYIYGLDYISTTNYDVVLSGTSMASPQVTGVVSLLLSVDPNLSVDEIKTILIESAEDEVGNSEDTPGWDQFYGHGRVNAYDALQRLTLDVNTFNEDTVAIYPNPLSNGSSLEILNLEEGPYTINVHNVLGQRVYNQEVLVNNSKLVLELPQLTSGAYFLKLDNTSVNTSVVKKLIIQ